MPPALADISGLTPCKESKQFAKREKQQLKKLESSLKLYAPDSAPALAIKATMEKTKKRLLLLEILFYSTKLGLLIHE